MGISLQPNLPNNMVTAQVYIALCVAGVAVAAPQLDFGGPRSVATTREVAPSNVNEADVVSNVVYALQPSIAKAVADALAGLQTSSLTSTSSQSSSSLSAANAAAAAAAEEATSLAADVGPVVKPEYNFEYKVADAEAQTYITQSENRDGDTLTGMYSYVNPDGALITVNYEAGPMGYSQTLDQQDGFVSINPQPVKAAVATSSTSSGSGSSSSSSSGFSGATSTASNAGFSSSTSSSSLDQSALIAQIIAALQPQISSAVQSAISSSSTRTVVAPAPAAVYPPRARLAPVAPVAAASGDLAGTFGNGFSVKIDTPEFNIAY